MVSSAFKDSKNLVFNDRFIAEKSDRACLANHHVLNLIERHTIGFVSEFKEH